MSRTFGLTTPSRRSKRLLASGYYVNQIQPSDVLDMLDVPASDDDDAASTDSWLSHSSEKRRVTYKESPTSVVFNHHRRRHHSGSPRASPGKSSNLLHKTDTEHKKITISERMMRKPASASSMHDATSVVGTVSAPNVAAQRRQLQRRHHTLHHLYGYEADEEGRSDGKHASGDITNVLQREHHHVRNFESFSQSVSQAQGDAIFKVPAPRPQTDHQGNLQDHSHSDENVFETETQAIKQNETAKRLVSFIINIIHFCAGIMWEAGRFVYQSVTRILVFDTWLLTLPVNVGPVHRSVAKYARALFMLALVVVVAFYIVGIPPQVRNMISKGTMIQVPAFSIQKDFTTYTPPDESNNEKFLKSLETLELYVRRMEVGFADRHAAVLHSVATLQSNYEKDLNRISENNYKLVTSVEENIEKSSSELSKSNEIFAAKVHHLQMQLDQLQSNHSKTVENLIEINRKEALNSGNSREMLLNMQQLQKSISSIETNLHGLKNEHRLLKSSFDQRGGNITFIRDISDDRFVENFLILLQKGTTTNEQVNANRRYQHLALVFMGWLQKRGFVQGSDLKNMQEGILENSTKLEVEIKSEFEKSIKAVKKEYSSKPTITLDNMVSHQKTSHSTKVTEALVKAWIREELDIYSADRIGIPDFALESSGGSIVNTRCSDTYQHKTALVSILGIPIYYNINTPRAVIQPNVMPGDCWAFKGSQGYIVIGLSATIHPTAFTIEHIPKSLALYNNISSAPKDFSVFGLDQANSNDGVLLGAFRYEQDGSPIQSYNVDRGYNVDVNFTYIELRVESNWGHPDFTCLYRFRVHGQKVIA